MKSDENNVTKFQNKHIYCTCIAVDKESVSIMSEISVSEHLTCNIKLYNIPKEKRVLFADKDNITLHFFENGQYHVIITQYRISSESRIIDESDSSIAESSYSVTYYSSVLLYGFDGRNCDIQFDGFSMDITEGKELIGVCPYNTNIDESTLSHPHISSVGSIISSLGNPFSYFVAPRIIKDKEGLQLCSYYSINYRPLTQVSLSEIKTTVQNMLLFFEVLSGEIVSANSVHLSIDNQTVEYLGIQNFFRTELSCFKSDLDTRSFLRLSLFKVSDFQNCFDEIIKNFINLYNDKPLAFKAYQQILLDDEQGIFTPNYFLKIAQIVEGFQRDDLNEDEQKFNTKKKHLIESLTDPDDINFISKYATYNGINFRKCLGNFTLDALLLITKESKSKIHKLTDNLVGSIVSDRDLYTHASTKGTLSILGDDLYDISHCYKMFFRVLILQRLGVSETLIRKRLSYDRFFTYNLNKWFGLSLSADMSHDTGKYDGEMFGYD